MRVLVASSWFPFPPDNGAKTRAWSLLNEMNARHDVTLLSFAEPGEARDDTLSTLRQACAEVVVVPGNPHKAGPALPVTGLVSRMPRSYAMTWSDEMARRLAAARATHDAVIGLEIGTALYLPPHVGWPRVFEEAELGQIIDAPASRGSTWQRLRHRLTCRKYTAFTRHLVECCSHTTVVSARERRRLGEAGCDVSRVSVVANGIDAACLTMRRPTVAGRLVYSGALTFDANLDAVRFFLADILPLLERDRPGITLHVTGSHAGAPLEGLPRRDALVLTGYLDDVRAFVAESHVCVVPLRRGGGTRLKIIEAMALGTPVVSTSKGVEGLDVEDGVHVLVADDAAGFAKAVVSVLESPALAARLAENARALVAATYTWSRIGGALDDALQAAVETERRRRKDA